MKRVEKSANGKEFGLFFWVHLLTILVGYSSPLWLDWRLIIIGIFILKLHYATNGNCFLTVIELGDDSDRTFVWHYLEKIFPGLDEYKTKYVVRNVVPIMIVLLGFVVQVVFGYSPYVVFNIF